MAKYLSAGVYIKEIDLSSFVEGTGGSAVAGVIKSAWGPADDIVLIGNIGDYAKLYGQPDLLDAKYFYVSKSILNATNLYNVVRTVDANAKNGTSKTDETYELKVTGITKEYEIGEIVQGQTSGSTAEIQSITTNAGAGVVLTEGYFTTGTLGLLSSFQVIADGEFQLSKDDGLAISVTGIDFAGTPATSGVLTTNNLTSSIGNFTAINDGEMRLITGAQEENLVGLNFTTAVDVNDIMGVIDAAITSTNVALTNDGSIITFTNTDTGASSTVSIISVPGGSGTDITGASLLNLTTPVDGVDSTAVTSLTEVTDTIRAAVIAADVSFTNVLVEFSTLDTNIKITSDTEGITSVMDMTAGLAGTDLTVASLLNGGTSTYGQAVGGEGRILNVIRMSARFIDEEFVNGLTSLAVGALETQPVIDIKIAYVNTTVEGFEAGEVITGQTSGSTGSIKRLETENGTTYLIVTSESVFTDNELIVGTTSAAEGVITSRAIFNDYTAGILIKNDDAFDKTASKPFKFIAAYPGTIGNSLSISICDSSTYGNWVYANLFDTAPEAGEYHMVVVDRVGLFYNKSEGEVLETYGYLTKIPGSVDEQGIATYYKDILNTQSGYMYAGDLDFEDEIDLATSIDMFNGINDNLTITDGDVINSYALFNDTTSTLVDYISGMDYNAIVLNGVYSDVVDVRKDCILFGSPQLGDVLSNSVLDNVTTWGASINYTSYIGLTNNWLYMTDTFNNTNIWVPDNGEMIRIKCAVDNNLDAWFSPMGYTKGLLQNVIKLAWSPIKGERDTLTQASINPIFTEIGSGTVLLGDRTHLRKPSYLRQIGVRAMFNKVETDIANFAKYTIGEFNNQITRTEFVLKVQKYMDGLLARQAFVDYRITCDETNNTEQVIAEQGFVALIKILPSSSVSWVEISFSPVSFANQLDS